MINKLICTMDAACPTIADQLVDLVERDRDQEQTPTGRPSWAADLPCRLLAPEVMNSDHGSLPDLLVGLARLCEVPLAAELVEARPGSL